MPANEGYYLLLYIVNGAMWPKMVGFKSAKSYKERFSNGKSLFVYVHYTVNGQLRPCPMFKFFIDYLLSVGYAMRVW